MEFVSISLHEEMDNRCKLFMEFELYDLINIDIDTFAIDLAKLYALQPCLAFILQSYMQFPCHCHFLQLKIYPYIKIYGNYGNIAWI